MNLADFSQAFEVYFSDNYNLTDIQFDNTPYTPDKDTPYVYCQIIPKTSITVIKGSNITRYEGDLRFYIYTPIGEGTRESFRIADNINELMERQRISTDLVTRSALPQPTGISGEHNRMVLNVSFALN